MVSESCYFFLLTYLFFARYFICVVLSLSQFCSHLVMFPILNLEEKITALEYVNILKYKREEEHMKENT